MSFNSGYNNPTVDDFKTKFFRNFPFGTDPATSVTDQDIVNAYELNNTMINQTIFPDQTTYSLGYLYLAAHNLVTQIAGSSQGINASANWVTASKSVGSVSESFSIPQQILDNPLYSMYSKTVYGMTYLQMIFPYLTGQMFFVPGTTLP